MALEFALCPICICAPSLQSLCGPIASLMCRRLEKLTGGFFGWQKDVADLVLALSHLNFWAEQAAQNMQWLGLQVCRCSPSPLFLSLRMSCFHVTLWTLHLFCLSSPITNFLCCTGNCILPSHTSPLTTAECVWHLQAVCSAPAQMDPPKASCMFPARKVSCSNMP